MHHPAQEYIAYILISGATPLARIDQSTAPAHHRTSAYPMQRSSRVGPVSVYMVHVRRARRLLTYWDGDQKTQVWIFSTGVSIRMLTHYYWPESRDSRPSITPKGQYWRSGPSWTWMGIDMHVLTMCSVMKIEVCPACGASSCDATAMWSYRRFALPPAVRRTWSFV